MIVFSRVIGSEKRVHPRAAPGWYNFVFGTPAVASEAWTTFLEGPEKEVRRNAGRRAVPYNRVAWSVPVVTLRAGSPPG